MNRIRVKYLEIYIKNSRRRNKGERKNFISSSSRRRMSRRKSSLSLMSRA